MSLSHPEGPRISIGDISFQEGGLMCWGPGGGPPCHDWHQMGRDADLRYVRANGTEDRYNFDNEVDPYPGYDQNKSDDLVKLFCKAGITRIFVDSRSDLDDDPDPPGCSIESRSGHSDHIHIHFN